MATFPPAVDEQNRSLCTATTRSGDRCRAPAMIGQGVCRKHGGRATQTMEKARERLAGASDRAVKVLLEILNDPSQTADARVRSARDILDRTLGPAMKSIVATQINLSAETADFDFDQQVEQLLAAVQEAAVPACGRCHEPCSACASHVVPSPPKRETPALPAAPIEDAEVVEAPLEAPVRPRIVARHSSGCRCYACAQTAVQRPEDPFCRANAELGGGRW